LDNNTTVLVCIANVDIPPMVTSDYVSAPMINCEDLKVTNFDIIFLIIVLISSI